jgi:hypothetical protein
MAGRGVIVVVVAALLGILVLRNVGAGSASSPNSTAKPKPATTPARPGSSTTRPTTITTVAKSSYVVLVANGSGTSGAASKLTNTLKTNGFQTANPTNAASRPQKTLVYYLEGYQPAANDVARFLKVAAPQPMPSPRPVTDLGRASVLVVEAADLAAASTTTS